jgi:tRNA nucleotidyltransferase/poly(A) polymerase
MTNTIANKIFEEQRKKISYDIHKETLKMIDELAEMIPISRAQILDMVIIPGIISQVGNMENAWREWIKSKEYQSKEKQEKLKKAIKMIESFKEKWGLNQFPKLVEEAMERKRKMDSVKKK